MSTDVQRLARRHAAQQGVCWHLAGDHDWDEISVWLDSLAEGRVLPLPLNVRFDDHTRKNRLWDDEGEELVQLPTMPLPEATASLARLTHSADENIVPFCLTWLDALRSRRWRERKAESFWMHTMLLLMVYAHPIDLPGLCKPHPQGWKAHSWVGKWVLRSRSQVSLVVELRSGSADPPAGPLPSMDDGLVEYMTKALGNPKWRPINQLTRWIVHPDFNPIGEQALLIYAGLLVHGNRETLSPLAEMAASQPMLGQILRYHERNPKT